VRALLPSGLAAVAGRAAVAYVTATDAPLLHPAFVGRAAVPAWTLRELASAVGLTLDARVAAVLNGAPVAADPELPLVAGDAVAFTEPGLVVSTIQVAVWPKAPAITPPSVRRRWPATPAYWKRGTSENPCADPGRRPPRRHGEDAVSR
jgi:hypothetical protein